MPEVKFNSETRNVNDLSNGYFTAFGRSGHVTVLYTASMVYTALYLTHVSV
jgi:hypothetical protein